MTPNPGRNDPSVRHGIDRCRDQPGYSEPNESACEVTERERQAKKEAPSVEAPARVEERVDIRRTTAPPEQATASGPEHNERSLGDLIIQAKLTVGPAGDPFEREADAMAARVVRTLRSGTATSAPDAEAQRDASDNDAGPARVQRSSHNSTPTASTPASAVRRIQRAANTSTIGSAGGDLDVDTTRLLRSSRAGGSPLPDAHRSKMESAFGADFGAVRVHTGPTSTELNNRIQAKAFTTGSDIYFRDSLPDVNSGSGQELLAHELTHTIQQGAAGAQRDVARTVDDAHIQRARAGAPPAAPAAPLGKIHDDFMQRISALEGEVPQLKGQNIAATGEALWAAYAGTITGRQGMSNGDGEVDLGPAGLSNKVPESAPGMRDNRATNPQGYNEDPGPGAAGGQPLARGSYETNMSESFNLLTTALKGLSQLQFDKYKTFAFWNSPGAIDVAKAAKGSGVLALESSAIGGLFDGFGSYDELAGGVESKSWDPQLWAELSRAYAAMVIDAIVKDPKKRIIVVCGIGFNDPGYNIWNSIESLTLKLGAKRAKMLEADLQAKTKYFGVAGQMDGNKPVVDMASTYEGIAGTWVSCSTAAEMVRWQAAQGRNHPK